LIAPHVVCTNPDGTASAYICELRDEETFSRWQAVLSRVEADEVIKDRYEEMGIETRYYRISDELLQGTWSYGEYGIRGPADLVSRLVAELLTEAS